MIAGQANPRKPPEARVLASGRRFVVPDMSSEPIRLTHRIVALADACVLCGLCLPHCPTYGLDRNEGESPRGRIMLMKALTQGRIQPEPIALRHLDHCLACGECERVCPAQVKYGELLDASRAQQRRVHSAVWPQRALEWLFASRWRLDLALDVARVLRRWCPGPWRRAPPPPPRRQFSVLHLAKSQARGCVALFIGCLGRHYDAGAIVASIKVLTALGWNVEVPRMQQCCGALSRHAGDESGYAALATRNRAAFAMTQASAVLTLASGCHDSIARGLRTDTDTAPAVRDLFEFLAADPEWPRLRLRRAASDAAVALHLPCTQRNVSRSAEPTARLLTQIPGLKLSPLAASGCCGAAGSHMLHEPTRADALRAPVLDAIAASQATTLCSANVGCRLHLSVGAQTRGLALRWRHPIEVIAEHLE